MVSQMYSNHCNCSDLHPTEEYNDITVKRCHRKACVKIHTGSDEFQYYALTLMKIPGNKLTARSNLIKQKQL